MEEEKNNPLEIEIKIDFVCCPACGAQAEKKIWIVGTRLLAWAIYCPKCSYFNDRDGSDGFFFLPEGRDN
jgi:hypothetical protein